MEKDNFSHFSNWKIVIENYCDEKAATYQFVKHLDSLLEEFNNRFEEFYNLEAFIILFFINPFAQIDDDVANKIAKYFDISNKDYLE